MARVDFVVCSWNNRDRIGATLEGIARQTVNDATCWLIDGRSTDGTPEFVRSNFPWVRVVVKAEDNGPAGSRTIGAELASGDYIVYVDSDVTLDAGWTEQQLQYFDAHPEVGLLCGKLLYAPNPGMLHTAYGVMNRFGVAWDGGIGEPAASFNKPVRCLWANTSAVAVRREVIERMGAFDVDLFMFHEDADFGWRANLFGYTVMSNPEAVANHMVNGTSDGRVRHDGAIYFLWRNRIRSALVNYEWQNILRYMVPYILMSIAHAIARPPRRSKFRAFWWNLVHLRKTLARRRFVQKNRTVRDHELWRLFVPGLFGPGHDAVRTLATAFSKRRPAFEGVKHEA